MEEKDFLHTSSYRQLAQKIVLYKTCTYFLSQETQQTSVKMFCVDLSSQKRAQ
jgi:hypothetical protein